MPSKNKLISLEASLLASLKTSIEGLAKANPIGINLGVACSGGLDSMVLLHACFTLREKFKLTNTTNICVLHLDHGLRTEGELKHEFDLLSSYCVKHSVSLYAHKIEADKLKVHSDFEEASLEAVARRERYATFLWWQKLLSLDLILMAHHLDDQEEEQLMRFFKGQGDGWQIPVQRDLFLRPFLQYRKEELRQLATNWNLVWHDDSSNQEHFFLRNKVRLDLIPVINSIFPGMTTSLSVLRSKKKEDDQFFDHYASQFNWQSSNSSGQPLVDQGPIEFLDNITDLTWNLLPIALRWRLIQKGLRKLLFAHNDPVLPGYFECKELTTRDKNHRFERYFVQDRMYLRRCIVAAVQNGYLVQVTRAGALDLPLIGQVIVRPANDGESAWLPEPPLVFRSFSSLSSAPSKESPSKAILEKKLTAAGVPAHAIGMVPVFESQGCVLALWIKPWNDRVSVLSINGEDLSLSYVMESKEFDSTS